MRRSALRVLQAGCLALVTAPAAAIDFTVDSLADTSIDHDSNPGDGVCDTNRGTTCSLRAAIQEANARSGGDRILFSVAGTIGLATEGPLPPITDALVILGSSAPGYNGSATRIGQAPPQIYIDGSLLSGSADGLSFGSGASSGFVDAIGIVGMPDDGIVISGSATQVTIDDCWVGVRADGSAGGNGDMGINIAADGNFIGATANAGGISGLGNLISGNGNHGIFIGAGADDNRVRGNWIGLNAAGTGARANAGWGIFVAGSGNRIGSVFNGTTPNAPVIAANAAGGIQLFGGTGNRVEAAVLGQNINGAGVASPGDGILVTGVDALIGGNSDLSGNTVANHVNGIRLGSGVLGASNARVERNRIGSTTFSQGVGNDGIWVETATGAQIVDNRVLNAARWGIRTGADGTLIQGNRIGFIVNIFGPQNHGPGQYGIRVEADGSTVIDNIVGFAGNSASGLQDGIIVRGSGNSIRFNFVGITPAGEDIGNDGYGVRIGTTVETSADNVVRSNVIRNNGGGVWLFGDATSVANTVDLNEIADNGGLPVNLIGDFGLDANDTGDPDEGVNRLMNRPEVVAAVADLSANPVTLDVTYRVDTNTTAASYPLLVDFYLGRASSYDAIELLDSDLYPEAEARLDRTYRIVLPPGLLGGYLVAQVQDFDGNSSEISLSVPFGMPDALFADGFEPLP